MKQLFFENLKKDDKIKHLFIDGRRGFMTYQEMLTKAATLTQVPDYLSLLEEMDYLEYEQFAPICEALTANPYFAEIPPESLSGIYKKIRKNNLLFSEKKINLAKTIYEKSGAVYSPELGRLLAYSAEVHASSISSTLAFFEKIIDNKPAPEQFASIYEEVNYTLKYYKQWSDLQRKGVLHLLDKLSQNVPDGLAAGYTKLAATAGINCGYSEVLPYVMRGMQMSDNNKGSYEAVCDYVCEMVHKRHADPADFFEILRKMATEGYQIPQAAFGKEGNIEAYQKEVENLRQRLQTGTHAYELYDYALSAAKVLSESHLMYDSDVLSMIETLQNNPRRPLEMLPVFEICNTVTGRSSSLSDRCLEIVTKEAAYGVREIEAAQSLIDAMQKFYRAFPHPESQQYQTDVAGLFANATRPDSYVNFVDLMMNCGKLDQAFAIIAAKINSLPLTGNHGAEANELLRCLLQTEAFADKEEQTAALVAKLLQRPDLSADKAVRRLNEIVENVLKRYPQQSERYFNIWQNLLVQRGKDVDGEMMIRGLTSLPVRSTDKILELAALVPLPEDTENKTKLLSHLLTMGNQAGEEQAGKIVRWAADRGLTPAMMFEDEKFARDSWNTFDIIEMLKLYKETLLRCQDVSEQELVQLEAINRMIADSSSWNYDRQESLDRIPGKWEQMQQAAEAGYAGLSEGEKKQLARILTTPALSREEKQHFFRKGLNGCLSCNLGIYLKVKDYMQKEAGSGAVTMQWLIPSAFSCAKIYGKDYMNYFRVIDNYNKALPKWQEECWNGDKKQAREDKEEKLRRQYKGYSFILDTLENLPDNRLLAKMALQKNLLLSPPKNREELKIVKQWQQDVLSDEKFCLPKERRRLELYCQSLLGTLYSTANYVEYRNLQPIGMEKATAWMVKAVEKDGDLPRIRRFFDRHLKAVNAIGETFLRLDAPHYSTERINDLNDCARSEVKFSDDYSLLADKLSYISDQELETLKYGEIYERLANIKYQYSDYDFAAANSAYISSQEDYDEAEELYRRGQITPSRFADKPVLYNDDQTLRCRVASKDDPRILFAGQHTSCCQSFGDVGGHCAIDSVTNPHSGCMIWEKKEQKGGEWQICGCSWFYESQNGKYKGLTFDNVEVENYYKNKGEVKKLLTRMVKEFAGDNYRYISVGQSNDDISMTGYRRLLSKNPLPQGYKGYTDASEKQKLLYENSNATAEKVDVPVICAGDMRDCQKLKTINRSIRRFSWHDGDKCVVLKDSGQVYAAAVWMHNEKRVILAADPQSAAVVPQQLSDFRDFALKCVGRDIDNPEIVDGLCLASAAVEKKNAAPSYRHIGSEYE